MSNAAAAADATPAPAPSRMRGKKKLIIIVAAAAVLLLAGGGGAFYLLSKKKATAQSEGDEDVAQVDTAKAPVAPRHDPKHPPVFAALDPFTVNLADRDVERYAQIAVTLELSDSSVTDQIKVYMPAIRNNILMVLAHKTSAEILSAEGKSRLAGEIQRATSRALGIAVPEPDDVIDETADGAMPKAKKKKRKAEVVLPVAAVHFANFIVQ
jgi:flagellar FliL protein